jgi:RNA polymerase sigma-70 factor (ECF subfamily)
MELSMDAPDLVRRCLNGDPQALAEFVDQYSGVVFQAVRATLWAADPSMAQEAEDIAEEILVGLLKDDRRALRAFDPSRDLRGWLYTVARGRCIDEVRRLVRHRRVRPLDDQAAGRVEAAAQASSEPPDPELAARVQAAVEALPDRQRLAVRMFFFDGKKYKEIAAALGISVSEVASYLHRAKERLAQALRGEG